MMHGGELATERSTLLGTRTQLALSRLQIEEATAARISQQLNDVRREAVGLTAKRAELSEQIKDMESRMPVQDLARDLQLQLKQYRIELDEITATEQERSTRESDLAGQLQAVQNHLAESRAQIGEMERSLDAAIQQLLQPH